MRMTVSFDDSFLDNVAEILRKDFNLNEDECRRRIKKLIIDSTPEVTPVCISKIFDNEMNKINSHIDINELRYPSLSDIRDSVRIAKSIGEENYVDCIRR